MLLVQNLFCLKNNYFSEYFKLNFLLIKNLKKLLSLLAKNFINLYYYITFQAFLLIRNS